MRYIIYAVTMCVIYFVIHYLHTRDNSKVDSGEDDTNYVVKMPAALKNVYLTMFVLGMIMCITFTVCRIKGVPSATVGLIRFSLIFAGIGLLVMIWASRWRICVDGERMEIHKLFHKRQVLLFSEIEKVEVTQKDQLILYKNGKRIVTVDLLSDNYNRLKKDLKEIFCQYEQTNSN